MSSSLSPDSTIDFQLLQREVETWRTPPRVGDVRRGRVENFEGSKPWAFHFQKSSVWESGFVDEDKLIGVVLVGFSPFVSPLQRFLAQNFQSFLGGFLAQQMVLKPISQNWIGFFIREGFNQKWRPCQEKFGGRKPCFCGNLIVVQKGCDWQK